MKYNKYDKENIFLTLPKEKLAILWEGYKKGVYETGWYEHDNPMLPYIMYYEKKYDSGGRKLAETNMLEAIAICLFEKENIL